MTKKICIMLLCICMGLVGACGKAEETEYGSEMPNQLTAEEQTEDAGEEALRSEDSSEKKSEAAEKEKADVVHKEKEQDRKDSKQANLKAEETAAETEKTEKPGEAVVNEVSQNEQPLTDGQTPEAGTPVAVHGELSVKGTNLVDRNGNNYQIKGVSTHGIGWFPQYVNKEAFRTLRDEWGANCVRLAMYSGEGAGYCTGGDQTQLKNLVSNGVDYATSLGMYIIIDWHVLGDQDPNIHKDTAKEFFREMSAKYADYENVIYEICNEPNGGVTWSAVKSYAEEVIPVIKENNPDAVIIVGTPTWSQDVDQAAKDPIKGYSNIMYALHFYADTHRDSLRQKMTDALKAGLPIFCTEFGICDASGAGANNKTEGEKWISLLDASHISYCIWSLCNKGETSALISSSCSKTSGWTMDDLSDSGKWYVGILNHGVTPGSTPAVYDSAAETSQQADAAESARQNTESSANSANGSLQNASASQKASSANMEAVISASNSWESGSRKNYQHVVRITNTGADTIRDWSITLDFGTNVTLEQGWSGTFKAGGSRMTITPADYNREIAAGQSVEAGFIISSIGEVDVPEIIIND